MEQILKLWLSSILFYTKFDDVDIKRSFVSFKLVCCFHPKYLWFEKRQCLGLVVVKPLSCENGCDDEKIMILFNREI